jgi:hypothetical protein
MWITESYNKNACSIWWMNNWLESWTWKEYRKQKEKFWDQIILVDMINHPLPNSVTITNELFDSSNKPAWTVFALYCHSWWSSWYIQMQLTPQLPMYKFVNIKGWIMSY